MNISRNNLRQSGFGMVEVLVTLVILLVGLLGLAGLMVQSQRSEMESYQRVQALVLLQDMAGRINANRAVAQCYAFTTNPTAGTPYVGTGVGSGGVGALPLPAACALGTAAQNTRFTTDITDWNNVLLGTAETSGGSNAGAMLGARGCISYDPSTELPPLDPLTGLPTGAPNIPGTGIYTVSIAWQGMGKTFANTSLLCGTGLYGEPANNDPSRRVVSLPVRIANLN